MLHTSRCRARRRPLPFARPSWGSARSTPSCCDSVLMRASGTSRSRRPVRRVALESRECELRDDAFEQNRVDGVMEDTDCDDDSQRRRDAGLL